MNAKGKTKVNFDDCLDDIKLSLQSIHNANPGLPVYLLGESMGGAIALRAASMYPDLVDGLISSVPASERFNQGKTSMKVFFNLLTGTNLANVGGDVVNQATQNSKLKAAWEGDPLDRLNLSPQELIQFQDFMNNNHDAAKRVSTMPVLFVQGNGDHLVKPEGTWELFNDVASTDKSFLAVPGEHLIFEEAQTQDPAVRDQNFRIISAWLATKVGYRHQGNWRGGLASAGTSNAGGTTTGGAGMGAPPGPNAGTWGGGGMGAPVGNNAGTWGGGGMGAPIGDNGGTRGGTSGWNAGNNGTGGLSSSGGAWGGGPTNGAGSAFGGGRPGINLQGLESQAQLIDSGQYPTAIAQLEQIRSQRPNDPNVIALLGKAYFRNGQTDQAAQLFRAAMRARRGGGDQAQALNSYLLNMSGAPTPVAVTSNVGQPTPTPDTSGSPFASFIRRISGSLAGGQFGGGTNGGASLENGPHGGNISGTGTSGGAFTGIGSANSGIVAPASKAKVYAFYANWADQCKDLPSTMNRLASTYGNLADITQVNIEDAASDNLVDRYKIGPIPTVVFVAPNGQVTSTIIGASQYDNYDQAMKSATRGVY